jgi:predicted small lipoprotein YifL
MTRQAFLRWILLAALAAPLLACGGRGKLDAPDDSNPESSEVVLPKIRTNQ